MNPAIPVPDNLAGHLIRQKRSGAVRSVVRDDGENGLWISHPAFTSQMYHIKRGEYRSAWEFYKFDAQITDEDLQGNSFDGRKAYQADVNLDHQAETHVSEQETQDMSREETDREAMKEEILGKNPADTTFDGDPVGANEEPAEMLEEDRKDPDASEEEDRKDPDASEEEDTEAHIKSKP
jgi:hypothetical protein